MYPASVARSRGRQGSPGGASAGQGGKEDGDAFDADDIELDDDDAGENANPPPPPLRSPLATRASASATSAVVSLEPCLVLRMAAAEEVKAAAGRDDDDAAALRRRSIRKRAPMPFSSFEFVFLCSRSCCRNEFSPIFLFLSLPPPLFLSLLSSSPPPACRLRNNLKRKRSTDDALPLVLRSP
jgi:hypothetical protein